MDFASLLSKEIAKTKPATAGPAEKYVKRADLERQREASYLAEQQAKQAAQEEAARKKRKLDEEEAEHGRIREEKRARLAEESKKRRAEEEARLEKARRKRLGLPELPAPSKDGAAASEADEDMDETELDAQFRKLGEPIRLFGESHKQRSRRYKRLTSKPKTGYTSLELVPEDDMLIQSAPKDAEGRKYLYRQLATWFTVVLREWEIALNARPAEVKESFQGKAASSAYLQSRENMKPLFAKFEKGDLDVLENVVEIVKAAQERRYVDANDAYLRLSIGKACV